MTIVPLTAVLFQLSATLNGLIQETSGEAQGYLVVVPVFYLFTVASPASAQGRPFDEQIISDFSCATITLYAPPCTLPSDSRKSYLPTSPYHIC